MKKWDFEQYDETMRKDVWLASAMVALARNDVTGVEAVRAADAVVDAYVERYQKPPVERGGGFEPILV